MPHGPPTTRLQLVGNSPLPLAHLHKDHPASPGHIPQVVRPPSRLHPGPVHNTPNRCACPAICSHQFSQDGDLVCARVNLQSTSRFAGQRHMGHQVIITAEHNGRKHQFKQTGSLLTGHISAMDSRGYGGFMRSSRVIPFTPCKPLYGSLSGRLEIAIMRPVLFHFPISSSFFIPRVSLLPSTGY